MSKTELNLRGNVIVADKFEGQVEAEVVITAELVSEGEDITIPAGSTLEEALQIILDAVDPDES